MTIKLPPPNLLDKILAMFGKKRAIALCDVVADESDSHVEKIARRESFWKVLFRSEKRELRGRLAKKKKLPARPLKVDRKEAVRRTLFAIKRPKTNEELIQVAGSGGYSTRNSFYRFTG